MRIIVLGGLGFIGSHLCSHLKSRGHDVLAYDANIANAPQWLKDLRHRYANVTTTYGDILDTEKLTDTFRTFGADAVINLAAKPGVEEAEKYQQEYHKINVIGVDSLLEACRNANIRRIVHSSSSSVYGEYAGMISELHQLAPKGFYGKTKAIGEDRIHLAYQRWKLNVRILRPFTVFGPYGRTDMAPWKFAKQIIKGETLKLHENSFRDFTSVHDVSRVFALAAEGTWEGCETYNIGSEKSHGASELAQLISESLGIPLRSEVVKLPSYMPSKTWSDSSSARSKLGWSPVVSFHDAIHEFASWFLKYASNKELL